MNLKFNYSEELIKFYNFSTKILLQKFLLIKTSLKSLYLLSIVIIYLQPDTLYKIKTGIQRYKIYVKNI
jgi:hypothetical protein